MHQLPGEVFGTLPTPDGRQQIWVVGTEEAYSTPVQPTFDEVYKTAYFALSKVLHRIPTAQLDTFYTWAKLKQDEEGDTLREFADWMANREAWSRDAFGTNQERGPIGPAKHLIKEANEFIDAHEQYESSLGEIADIIFLAFDIATRSGYTFSEVVEALQNKLTINRSREWPKGNPNEPIEHNRAKDTASVHGSNPSESG